MVPLSAGQQVEHTTPKSCRHVYLVSAARDIQASKKLAKGEYGNDTDVTQACRDAYATSKFCNIVSARIFARRHSQIARFFSFDPGLMPGTGLARKQPRAARWVWNHILPRLVPFLPGTSTPEKSAALLTDLLTGQVRGTYSGPYFNYTGR
jgi:hypothetical protein